MHVYPHIPGVLRHSDSSAQNIGICVRNIFFLVIIEMNTLVLPAVRPVYRGIYAHHLRPRNYLHIAGGRCVFHFLLFICVYSNPLCNISRFHQVGHRIRLCKQKPGDIGCGRVADSAVNPDIPDTWICLIIASRLSAKSRRIHSFYRLFFTVVLEHLGSCAASQHVRSILLHLNII